SGSIPIILPGTSGDSFGGDNSTSQGYVPLERGRTGRSAERPGRSPRIAVNEICPPNPGDPQDHRGRIQAQGGGLEASEPWSQTTPLTQSEGLALLDSLVSKIGPKEAGKRQIAVARAIRFIMNAANGGGVGVTNVSFLEPGTKDIRIDIEVRAGSAFVP
ncbi:hypothetical protein, partial [Flavobacterium sp.]|uniref:hypothetical protein n=1 Tax=Flavobacterium sp. TaxID=239 RepID=UPI0025C117ED